MLQLAVAIGLVIAFAGFVLLAYIRRWQWTGLPAPTASNADVETSRPKTLWDWLQLLGIPVALASLAFLLNDAQSRRDQRREDQRALQQRASALDAEQESTLRTYLAQMSDLMLDRGLLHSKRGSDVREVARTATLTTVRRLDGPRRGMVLQFLDEARLLRREKHRSAKVSLASADFSRAKVTDLYLAAANLGGANLRGADLSEVHLRGAELSGANLRGANLFAVDLSGAELDRANLSGADLHDATLDNADFHGAYLGRANLNGAMLQGAGLQGASLDKADLSWTDFSYADRRSILTQAILRGANLTGADLSDADLSDADLSGANLSKANLSNANLKHANLKHANLSQANLRGAHHVDTTGSRGAPASAP
jgi:uncharacterized protein YjbI with pentapeptide repeats